MLPCEASNIAAGLLRVYMALGSALEDLRGLKVLGAEDCGG